MGWLHRFVFWYVCVRFLHFQQTHADFKSAVRAIFPGRFRWACSCSILRPSIIQDWRKKKFSMRATRTLAAVRVPKRKRAMPSEVNVAPLLFHNCQAKYVQYSFWCKQKPYKNCMTPRRRLYLLAIVVTVFLLRSISRGILISNGKLSLLSTVLSNET